jgi:signal transduction histidine kinase
MAPKNLSIKKRNKKSSELHFDVSSGLKDILGKDLITDERVAIFELVKNSFDAGANQVYLFFDEHKVAVVDNGCGMSHEDILKKWLFVAYSSKREGKAGNFRDGMGNRKYYAGSKGIGRFSSDRLGQIINLQTRAGSEASGPVHSVTLNWERFNNDHAEHFENITASYVKLGNFTLPAGVPAMGSGTAIVIKKRDGEWDRDVILSIKSSLAKLINPFGSSVDEFRITIVAPFQEVEDAASRRQASDTGRELPQNMLVNGDVGNFIFSTLKEKTTYIDVSMDSTQNKIETSLTDRGELIYRIREPNTYPLLSNSGFRCTLFFLNRSAKIAFSRKMGGVSSVQFGSVFLFRNGFRVFPIGEEGDDWFMLDRRKAQGYARYLGTRDVIGRIDVIAPAGDDSFREATSRDAGLVMTKAVGELKGCFIEQCLKRLENYIVPVTFPDFEDKDSSDISRLMTDSGRARVASAVARLADSKEVELLEYSRNLIGILNDRSEQFEGSLSNLRAIAEKTNDNLFLKNINKAEKRFKELLRFNEIAIRQADEERKAKEDALNRAAMAENTTALVTEQLKEEKSRSLFLSSIATLDTETILNLHHQVTIYAVDIQQQIENFIIRVSKRLTVDTPDLIDALGRISLLNRKVMGVSKFATKANFRLESEKIEADLADYIEQYINDVAKGFLFGSVNIDVENDHKGFLQKFKPIDISVVIDNLIANAKKARANNITFKIFHPSKNTIHIFVADNGRGFNGRISDIERIFEKGFTTTDGSGLGLFHVRQVLGEMNGTIGPVRENNQQGASFLIRISK